MRDKLDKGFDPTPSIRRCVFCGKPPSHKNCEHVLPLWLIEQTGDPKREIRVALDSDSEPKAFAFDQFKFPACTKCNDRYARLEGCVSAIFRKLWSRAPLNQKEWILLLDWSDKVRVGLWLGLSMLFKNPHKIEPRFAIDQRIRRLDRILMLAHSSVSRTGLLFSTPLERVFYFMPSYICIYANGLVLVNASSSSLASGLLRLPEIRGADFNSDDTLTVKIRSCNGGAPIQPPFASRGFAVVAQCIYPAELVSDELFSAVTDRMRHGNAQSVPHLWVNRVWTPLSNKESASWTPEPFDDPGRMIQSANRATLRLLRYLMKRLPRNSQAEYRSFRQAVSRGLGIFFKKAQGR